MSQDLSPSEVAARIGTSTRTIQRWISSGRLPARRVGGRWRVASDAFVASGVAQRPPMAPVAGPAVSPIRTVFIANRGEIARRVARTSERLGMRAVAPATEGADALDLLDIEAVVAAARAAGADAVHPGFGFLAEHADFAQRVIDAGIRWVGPPPGAIRRMGDKAAARRIAADLGVPILPGYDDADQSDAALLAAAEAIGLPLLVKPSAGGGGKGMRTVRDAAHLPADLAAARREARSAFGDDRLILERLIEGARHVEVQVLFDGAGDGIHLGERDCSIQRRHQKVLEEAGSPAVGPELRSAMGAAALTLGRAVGYVSAGTCEFLLDDRGTFTFLEMNTRLQVEHPVTEFVTGRDLVADQLRIAAGEPLGIAQDEIAFAGHAVEVRLYAEDAEAGFLPATGRLERLRWPLGDGVRVDAGVDEGDEIGGRFDPMLAKIVAHGADRSQALDRLTDALDATVVLGLTTNLRFLRWLVREPVVRAGEARTDTLERIWPPDDWPDRTAIPDRAWALAAGHLAGGDGSAAGPAGGGPGGTGGERMDPWHGGFRVNDAPVVRLAADGQVRTVRVPPPGGIARSPDALAAIAVGDTVHLDLAGRSTAFRLASPPDVDRAASAAAAAGGTGPVELLAPMPGRVLAIEAPVGTAVEVGAPVLSLEAMKMEHAVASPGAGRVAEVLVAVGDQVERGQRLAVVDPG